jgi:hypothetical protein
MIKTLYHLHQYTVYRILDTEPGIQYLGERAKNCSCSCSFNILLFSCCEELTLDKSHPGYRADF